MAWGKRNSRQRAGSGWAWQALRTRILIRDGYRCGWCDGPAVTADHILAVSAGGTDDDSNLVSSCHPCNERRRQQQVAAALGRTVKRQPEKHPGAVA